MSLEEAMQAKTEKETPAFDGYGTVEFSRGVLGIHTLILAKEDLGLGKGRKRTNTSPSGVPRVPHRTIASSGSSARSAFTRFFNPNRFHTAATVTVVRHARYIPRSPFTLFFTQNGKILRFAKD